VVLVSFTLILTLVQFRLFRSQQDT
jgi:hypothetical protein